MRSAVALRSEIEAALAQRIPSALTPVARTIRPVVPTGVPAVDTAAGGGLAVGALTARVGAEGSGRTSLALSFVAEVMREGKVCAWVDVSDALSPESAAGCGVDLARLLWVRCGVVRSEQVEWRGFTKGGGFEVPQKYFVPKPVVKGLHGGGMGGHPREEERGMDAAVSGLLAERWVGEVFEEARSGRRPFAGCERYPTLCEGAAKDGPPDRGGAADRGRQGRPWTRMEQALRATDLLLQAGGFGAIVLDMGGLAAEHVSRIPLATWFRYRAGAERTQASVVLLSQYACAKSSAGLVLRMEHAGAVTDGATVLRGFERREAVSRRRFSVEARVVPIRKPPQRAGGVTWQSGTAWAGRR